MPEFNKNLWAPWRMDYIRSLDGEQQETGCFLCAYRDDPAHDASNHVVWRSELAFVVMNRFPYTNGHLLVGSTSHKADFGDLSKEESFALTCAIRDCTTLLRETVKAEGFNVGYNLGLCAGAGLPGHIHAHVVPRWSGDTNYMAVLGNARVVPDSLDALYEQLVESARRRGLDR
jgi:ATP adenylyltransferase